MLELFHHPGIIILVVVHCASKERRVNLSSQSCIENQRQVLRRHVTIPLTAGHYKDVARILVAANVTALPNVNVSSLIRFFQSR